MRLCRRCCWRPASTRQKSRKSSTANSSIVSSARSARRTAVKDIAGVVSVADAVAAVADLSAAVVAAGAAIMVAVVARRTVSGTCRVRVAAGSLSTECSTRIWKSRQPRGTTKIHKDKYRDRSRRKR